MGYFETSLTANLKADLAPVCEADSAGEIAIRQYLTKHQCSLPIMTEQGNNEKTTRAGKIANFTGISSPFEFLEHPDVVLMAGIATPEQMAEQIYEKLITIIEDRR